MFKQHKMTLRTEKTDNPCRQCFVENADDDGFCSDTCMKEHDLQLAGESEGD